MPRHDYAFSYSCLFVFIRGFNLVRPSLAFLIPVLALLIFSQFIVAPTHAAVSLRRMSFFLGFDSSTQSLKALIIDAAAGKIAAAATVNFGKDLPQYHSPEGVLANADPAVKHADPLLWLAALDLALRRLADSGAPLAAVRGIGGSGQQHGSVYLNNTAAAALAALDPARSLADQLAGIFSRKTSPIWMDSSTGTEVREIGTALGKRLQDDTGSPAIERFTGPQIRRFLKTDPLGFARTARIHLVSSFMASVLVGKDAPIDRGDGAGMNLLNLRAGRWDKAAADATAPGLERLLPPVATAAGTLAGKLHPYFAKYGLPAGIPVALWTGDNPASLIGMGAHRPGKAVVSLGTSDTVFAAFEKFHTDPDGFGHVFGNPAGGNMSLACFKNGSLARDRIRAETGADWTFFDETAFAQTQPGNGGRLALPWFEPEITPSGRPVGLRANFDFAAAAPAVRIRAAVEGQVLSRALHSAWVGRFDTLRVTGGASRSKGILQTLADVFQAKVETIAVTDSAALGAALIAAHDTGGFAYDTLAAAFCPTGETILPRPETAPIYAALLPEIRKLEG
ncbi:MAG: carbohydrate kinase [Puniceicoccales bacterium]|jgi:xylulokinase|nr:carbohydrate kinase [Puniceicoccales bacterium]